jgi:hypothetical protein
LVAPPTGPELLPWKQLFEDEYVPKVGAVHVLSLKTNPEISKYLTDQIIAAAQSKEAKIRARQVLDGCTSSSTIASSIVALGRIPHKDVSDKAVAFLQDLQLRHGSDTDRDELQEQVQAYRTGLKELSDSQRFFLSLDKLSFRGTVHCEACLASLLPAFTQHVPKDDPIYKEIKILPAMQVGYLRSRMFLLSDP